jgi:hypothetical protein
MNLTHDLSKSIGQLGKDERTWPELSALGYAYHRQQTTVRIGKKHFIVLDRFLSSQAKQNVVETYHKHLGIKDDPSPKAGKNESA